jgi:hypothetical protein
VTLIERQLRDEQVKLREGIVRSQRDLAELMLRAADELARLNRERNELVAHLHGISKQTANMVTAHGGIR